MSITAISGNNVSVLNSLYALGKIGNAPSLVGSGAADGNGATISQIRDQVDMLATSGKLTTMQQVTLIASGFQDLNANDPSYQPAGQTGYTRATTGTFDLAGTLEGIGSFDSGHGDFTDGARFTDLADVFKHDNVSNSVDVNG